MIATTQRSLEFDPYKRSPAARLLAIIVTGLLVGWLARGGEQLQTAQLRRDPAKFYKHMDSLAHRSPATDVIIALVLVTVIVFVVDGLTALFGRWLKERHDPGEFRNSGMP